MVAEIKPITFPAVKVLIAELAKQEELKYCPAPGCGWPLVFNLPRGKTTRCINPDCPAKTEAGQ